ncbi:hypothetical protein BJ322DRAFT_708536 [Thelephora terrestris]|uniref:Uncharacterized protein n=1 Tax=Thelephora terrestris TaxID=56493 RepID=A0A9P6L8I7_9AGAM|nr:hypothetical protein BJ322DRAFT_708536 [Thelephora terrestris]
MITPRRRCILMKASSMARMPSRQTSQITRSRHNLGRAMEVQAQVWYRQRRFQDATSEALHPMMIYEKLGATRDVKSCRALLGHVGKAIKRQASGTLRLESSLEFRGEEDAIRKGTIPRGTTPLNGTVSNSGSIASSSTGTQVTDQTPWWTPRS